MNGVAGNMSIEPVPGMQFKPNWVTREYWSPHVAFYVRPNSALNGIA